MDDIHLIKWFLDFIGFHNGENLFSTRMYNFWSGFGGNISILALIGTTVGVYRHNLKRIKELNPVNLVQKIEKEREQHREEKEKKDL